MKQRLSFSLIRRLRENIKSDSPFRNLLQNKETPAELQLKSSFGLYDQFCTGFNRSCIYLQIWLNVPVMDYASIDLGKAEPSTLLTAASEGWTCSGCVGMQEQRSWELLQEDIF